MHINNPCSSDAGYPFPNQEFMEPTTRPQPETPPFENYSSPYFSQIHPAWFFPVFTYIWPVPFTIK